MFNETYHIIDYIHHYFPTVTPVWLVLVLGPHIESTTPLISGKIIWLVIT